MHLVTWNLDGLDPRHLDLRTEAAIAALLADLPDVILLQEVTRRTWHAHLRPHLAHAGYAAAAVVPDDAEAYVPLTLDLLFENIDRTFSGRRLVNRVDPARGY